LSSPWGRPAEFDEANVLATRAVVRAAGGAGVTRLIHVSTPSLYFGFHDRLDIPEDAPPADPPPNLYAASKLAAESEVGTAAAAGLATVILRPRAIFGPGDTVLFPRLLRVARRGRFPLIGRGDPWLDATYVDNVVDALLLAARAPDSCVGRTYNITNGEPWRREALLRAMFDACGLEVRWRRLPRGPVMAAAGALEVISRLATRGRWEPPLTRYTAGVLAYSQTLDLTAARRDLGYSPRVGMAQGIAHFARWWLKEGYAHH
jgi:nucleoside-diphosphate-sugar epimerase